MIQEHIKPLQNFFDNDKEAHISSETAEPILSNSKVTNPCSKLNRNPPKKPKYEESPIIEMRTIEHDMRIAHMDEEHNKRILQMNKEHDIRLSIMQSEHEIKMKIYDKILHESVTNYGVNNYETVTNYANFPQNSLSDINLVNDVSALSQFDFSKK